MHYVRYLILTGLLLSGLTIFAQADSEYTPTELERFAQVFLEMKNVVRTDTLTSIPGISNERLGQLVRAGISGEALSLTDQEKRALEQQKGAVEKYEEERLKEIAKHCEEHNLDTQTYLEMLQRFRSDIAFQHELRPYFQEYFSTGQ